jgi:hypothetical protein
MTTRRTFLLGSGIAAAGTLVPVPALADPDVDAQSAGRVDTAGPRFTIAVIPDTQYLFDEDRGNPEPLDTSLRYLLEHTGRTTSCSPRISAT